MDTLTVQFTSKEALSYDESFWDIEKALHYPFQDRARRHGRHVQHSGNRRRT